MNNRHVCYEGDMNSDPYISKDLLSNWIVSYHYIHFCGEGV